MANLDWDAILDECEVTEQEEFEYIALDEGDYKFKVEDIKYDEFNGSDKIPACKRARLSATVDTDKGKAYASYNFYLYDGEGVSRIYRFLKSVGMDDKSKPIGKLFSDAISNQAEGMAHIKPSEYQGKTYNNIVYFKNGSEEKKGWDEF